MLARKLRLTKSRDIQNVLKKGRFKHVGDLFLIKWLNNDLDHHRYTVVVSAKVSKSAVMRNRINRVLTGDIPPELLLDDANYDIVVVAKKEIINSLPEAHRALLAQLTSLKNQNNAR